MTFTILGFCKRTGKAGFCQTTSTPAAGWRCTDIVPQRGLATVQAHADVRQLQTAKRLLEFGFGPMKVLKDLQESDQFIEYRQIAILDFQGNAATFTGNKAYGWAGEVVGKTHVAAGNVLVGKQVVDSMSQTFEEYETYELEERLLKAIEAGRDAGGQPDGQTSSALVVYDKEEFPIVNLRVDVALEPVAELRKIFDWFKHLIPYYVSRTLDPSSVKRFRAVLDELGLPQNPYNNS